MTTFVQSRPQYAFGFGRVGVLQELLLSQADIERLVTTQSEKDLTKALSDLKIAMNVPYNSHPHRFINSIEIWLSKELMTLVDNDNARDALSILWMKDDTSLVAYLLKKYHRFTSEISIEPEVGATASSVELYRECIEKGESIGLSKEMNEWLHSMRSLTGISPQEIDARTAQYFALEQVKRAEKVSPAILLYVRHHIDLQNIRTAQRLARSKTPITPHLLVGGTIPVEHFSEGLSTLALHIKNSELKEILSSDSARDDFILLERALIKELAEDLASMRAQILTIEPIFAFGAIAVSQLKVLRTILVGKSAGLKVDEMRNLLPPFLSASPFAS